MAIDTFEPNPEGKTAVSRAETQGDFVTYQRLVVCCKIGENLLENT